MTRYIKVNNEWVDTLIEQKEYGRYYWIEKGIVYYTEDEYLFDHEVGRLQDESNEPIKNGVTEFLKEVPNGSYSKYREWCTGKPVCQNKFRRLKQENNNESNFN